MLKAPIGILGGTFDPIHIGHLRPAIEARDALGLAEVRLLPNHIPPHRANPFCSSEQRLAMVALAAAENPGFVVDERELQRDKPSWTIDTLIELSQELLDHAHLVVSKRPGWQPDYPGEVASLLARHQTRDVQDLHQHRQGHVWIADNLPIELSATRLRALLAAGQDPRYLLPAPVADYIRRHRLYQPSPSR